MAVFVGTIEEFKRYIGPRVKNVVNAMTKGYRKDIGKCEHCSGANDLQSAHIAGKERPGIIADVLKDHTHNAQINIDLEHFESALKEKHYPLNETILVLCKPCHTEYDKKEPPTLDVEILDKGSELTSTEREILEITLDPPNPDDFKNALIRSKRAKIITMFSNGERRTSEWKAEGITTKSKIFGNLRSRREFRSGNWQKNGIAKVVVHVLQVV